MVTVWLYTGKRNSEVPFGDDVLIKTFICSGFPWFSAYFPVNFPLFFLPGSQHRGRHGLFQWPGWLVVCNLLGGRNTLVDPAGRFDQKTPLFFFPSIHWMSYSISWLNPMKSDYRSFKSDYIYIDPLNLTRSYIFVAFNWLLIWLATASTLAGWQGTLATPGSPRCHLFDGLCCRHRLSFSDRDWFWTCLTTLW